MMITLRLVSITTEDLDTLEAFYSELFGKSPERVQPERLLEYEFDGVLFGLYDPTADDNPKDIDRGNSTIPAFKTDEFEQHKQFIEQHEATEVLEEHHVNDHHWFMFTDPEGNQLEIYEHSA